jgi:hypothetical protein
MIARPGLIGSLGGCQLRSPGESNGSDDNDWGRTGSPGCSGWPGPRSTVCCADLGSSACPVWSRDPHPNRYEWPVPGDLVHLDTKKLGKMGPRTGKRFDHGQRGRSNRLGWSVVHVAVDDHSRLAYVEELEDESPEATLGFFLRARVLLAGPGLLRSVRDRRASCPDR